MSNQLVGAMVLTVVATIAVGVVLLGRRPWSPLAGPLAVVLVATGWWATAGMAMAAAHDAEHAARAVVSLLASAALLASGSLWHSTTYAGQLSRWAWQRVWPALLVEPVAVAVATLWSRELLVGVTEVGPRLVLVPGPVFWVHVAYCFTLLAAGGVRLLQAWRRAVTGQRRQVAIALVALGLPAAGAAVSVLVDLHPVAIGVTTALLLGTVGLWLWVEHADSRMRQLPVPTHRVLEVIGDAVLVIDAGGRVIQANPAAEAMFAASGQGGRLEGRPWPEVAPSQHLAAVQAGRLVTTSSGHVLDIRVADIRDGGALSATVVVLRDVTDVERLRHELAEQAVRDGLTGLHNRRHLDQVLGATVEAARQSSRPLTAVMVDIDRFKAVNDEHGHAVGDAVLVAVARALSQAVPPGCELVRFGGEEFLALLPRTHAVHVAEHMEAFRLRCAHLGLVGPAGPVMVTVSVGIAELEAGGSPDVLLRAADDALYRAKAAGRNRVTVAAHALS